MSKEWLDTEVKDKVLEYVKTAVNEYHKGEQIFEPRRLVEIMNVVSAGIAIMNENMGRLESMYAKYFNDMRPECKSDKQVQSLWDATEEGQEQIEYKYMLKGCQSIVSAVKRTLRELELEVKNLH